MLVNLNRHPLALPRLDRERIFALLLVAGAWWAWCHRLGISDLDDAASSEVLFARGSLSNILFHLKWSDQSPLYFVALHFWRGFGESPGAIKTLNLLAVAASIVLLHEVALLLCRSKAVALGTLALAVLSPASLWVVRNGRMYSLQLLLWTACLYFLLRYASPPRSAYHLVGFGCAAALSIYNHFEGFVSTGTALLWLVLEDLMGPPAIPTLKDQPPRGRLAVPALTALAILLIGLPQVFRLVHLLRASPPLSVGWSLPDTRTQFLDHLSFFWFINGAWGALSGWSPALRLFYLVACYALFIVGLNEETGRLARVALTTFVLPIIAGGLAAATHADLRDRYFLYLLPILWIGIANGALGGGWREGPLSRPSYFLRRGMLGFVVIVSAWLLVNKLPERYSEWEKLWSGLQELGHPEMALYMPPGATTAMPELLASQPNHSRIAASIEPLSEETRARFLSEAAAGRDFAFLVHGNFRNAELEWRGGYLREIGYRKVMLPVWGAYAEIFSRNAIPFARVKQLDHAITAPEVVRWVRTRLRDHTRVSPDGSPLGRALVARVYGDGTSEESTFFVSQRGESGYWRIEEDQRDAVSEERVWTKSGDAEMILAHAKSDSLLAIAFPGLPLRRTLRVDCGSRDPNSRPGGAAVSIEIFLDDERAASAACPVARPWTEVDLSTAGHYRQRADVTLLLSSVGAEASDIAFRLKPAGRSVAPNEAQRPPISPVVLTVSHPLSASLDRLSVYRASRSGFGRLPSRLEKAVLSAAVMHESGGSSGEGSLATRWRLSDLVWDAVGHTLQRCGGEARAGLWAHPKDGTTLVIEVERAALGPLLEGFYGVTDYAVEQARLERIHEPIRVRALVDGRVILDQLLERTGGWRTFSVPIGRAPGTFAFLRVEVETDRDSWAHFVIDLWSS